VFGSGERVVSWGEGVLPFLGGAPPKPPRSDLKTAIVNKILAGTGLAPKHANHGQ
jgi:hypothetical protein